MTATVAFIKTGSPPGVPGVAIARVRAMETISVPGSTTTTAEDGEMIIIGNGEALMIRAAFGTTPDADATAENGAVTSAGFSIPAGQVSIPIAAVSGAKVNLKADD